MASGLLVGRSLKVGIVPLVLPSAYRFFILSAAQSLPPLSFIFKSKLYVEPDPAHCSSRLKGYDVIRLWSYGIINFEPPACASVLAYKVIGGPNA